MAGGKDVEVVVGAVDRFTETLGKAAAALGALYGVYRLGTEAVKNAEEQEDAEARLAAALGRTSQALLDYAGAVQMSTKYGDDSVILAEAAVAAFIKDENQIKQVTAAAMDLASAYGMDLKASAELLTKSIASSTNALSRYGIEITGAVGSAERLEGAVNAVNSAFGGQAAAAGSTYSGTVVHLANAWGDLLEVFGNVVIRNPAVIKALQMLVGGLESLGIQANESKSSMREFVQDGLGLAVRTFGAVAQGVSLLQIAFGDLRATFDQVVYWIVTGLDKLLEPFNWIGEKLVDLGLADYNPFAGMSEGVTRFRIAVAETLIESREKVLSSVDDYNKLKQTINETADAIAAVDVSHETTPLIPPSTIPALEEENGIRYELLRQRYDAERALASEHGQWSAEFQAANMAVFEAGLLDQFDKLQANKASEAEMEYAFETMRLQRAAFAAQQQAQLEQMRAAATTEALNNTMAWAQVMYQRGGENARKYLSIYKTAAIAQTIMDTYKGAQGAYAALAGIPIVGPALGVAAAVAAIAAGMARVQAIRSMSLDGGGGSMPGGSDGGAVGTYPANPYTGFPEAPKVGNDGIEGGGNVIVNARIVAPLGKDYTQEDWDRIAEECLQPAFSRNGERGVQISASAVATE